MNYAETIEWLDSLKVEGGYKTQHGLLGMEKILTLSRIEALLHKLGDPQEKFKSIHIAGTSGKGSTAYFTASILQEAALKVGRFVSPHLQNLNDEIAVNNASISNECFASRASEIEEKCSEIEVAQGYPTRFEVLTSLAFLHFAREKVDIAIVEAGLGGERDATNVVKPLISLITSVSLDHLKTLGSTLEEIALNKAGIIKKETPVVIGNLPPEALKIIEKKAEEQNASLIFSHPCKLREMNFNGIKFTSIFEGKEIVLEARTPGIFQIENAGHAVKVAELLAVRGYNVDEKAIVNGFRTVSIPCRFEAIQLKPLIILDGAHNQAKVAALVETLRLLKTKPDFLVGILAAKPAGEILNLLRPVANSFTFVQPQLGKNFHSIEQLQSITDTRGIESWAIGGTEKEVFEFLKKYKGELLCVTGSLYLAGMARNYWFPPVKTEELTQQQQ